MPTEDQVRPDVVKAFADATNHSVADINNIVRYNNDNIAIVLHMSDPAKNAMAAPLSEISHVKYGGLVVRMSDMQNCSTVTDCIKLTTRRANKQAD